MISHIPRSSRIFIGLLIITLLLTYIAMTLAFERNRELMSAINVSTPRPVHEQKPQILDTTNWKTYTDSKDHISFLYPTGWKVTQDTKLKNYSTITISDPNTKLSMHFYASKISYLGLDGLEQKPYNVNGTTGSIVTDNLVSAKAGEYYYTFDGSLAPKLSNEFHTILSTVKFQ